MKRFFIINILCGLTMLLQAQELDCSVTINTPKLQTADPKVFATLKTTLEEFMNNTKWTDDVYEQTERIKVNLNITIRTEVSATQFDADFAIQVTRPVYGSDYETPLINHVDKDVSFTYQQFQPIQYSKNTYIDNLSSVLSFYAYMALGYDYDTFSPYGGETYFQTAQEIVNLIPQTGGFTNGWQVKDKRGRYVMIENLLNPRLKPMRMAFYNYHRNGLDNATKNADQTKIVLLQSLDEIDKIAASMLNSMIVQMFVNSKSAEIIEVFKMGAPPQKQRVNQIMIKLDPANSSKYRDIGF